MAKKSKQKHRPSEATPQSLSTEALIEKAHDDFSHPNCRRNSPTLPGKGRPSIRPSNSSAGNITKKPPRLPSRLADIAVPTEDSIHPYEGVAEP